MPRLGVCEAITPLPQYFFMVWYLVKHSDNILGLTYFSPDWIIGFSWILKITILLSL
jgi:hypothetical protein